MNRRKRMTEGLDAEIRDHIERETQLNIDRGMAPEAARRAALLKFGNAECAKEDARAVWTLPWLDQLKRDLGFGLRLLRRSPGFAAVAIVTLALGIGANTAIFSAVNGILLRPLPYYQASRLVTVERGQISWSLTAAQLLEVRAATTDLEHLDRYSYGDLALAEGTNTTGQVRAYYVTDGLFSMLGVRPLLGRPILPEDMQPSGDHVALLNYNLWMHKFGGDPGIVGRKISLNQQPYTVIGVMPKEYGLGIFYTLSQFPGLSGTSFEGIWLPRTLGPTYRGGEVAGGLMVGRLKEGATLAELSAELKPLSDRFAAAQFRTWNPGGPLGIALLAHKLSPGVSAQLHAQLLILMGAVGFVLLMACVNVAALLVARSWARQHELTIRKALGATRLRIARQFLSESLLLALGGGGLGLLFSVWGTRLLRVMAPPSTPRLEWVGLDTNVLSFTMAISLLVAILVGSAPAFRATSGNVKTTLKGGPGSVAIAAGSKSTHRLRSALVVAEVLLGVIVVTGGALMARSFDKLMTLDTVARPSHVISLEWQISNSLCNKAKDPATCLTLAVDRAADGIRSLGDVQQAALAAGRSPFSGGAGVAHYPGGGLQGLYLPGRSGDQLPSRGGLDVGPVTPGYFATLGVRLLRGRDFEWSEMSDPHVAIVSRAFAHKYFTGNPLGQRFSLMPGDKNPLMSAFFEWKEIIGEVSDVRDRGVSPYDNPPSFYVPLGVSMGGPIEVVARTAADPMPLVPAIERTMRAVNPIAQVSHIETVDEVLAQSSVEPRFNTLLLGSFGALGLLLAIVGVYGVISYAVVQRTHEIGVRMALGAQRGDILGMVLREGMLLAVLGVVLGVTGALAVTRVLRNMLFEITPNDPVTFAGVAVLLLLAAFLACWIPARRAMRVDPTVALRYE